MKRKKRSREWGLSPRISYVYGKGSCPVAEDLASRVLTLPTYYGLPLEDVRAIAGNVVEIVASC